jgi:hypothetical protein
MINISKFELVMRNIYLLLMCLIFFLACQVEEDTQVINNDNGLNSGSVLTQNLLRLTQNPTAFDDFIDGSSKIRVEFPAQISINNNVDFSLNSEEDYTELINILENTTIQDDIVFIYPITVSSIDYSVETLNNASELNQLLQSLSESSEVNCLEIDYPLGIRFFDSSNAFVDSQTINNEAQFFNFLIEIDSNNLFYELEFPVNVNVDTGSGQQFQASVNSNEELISIYNQLPNSCFEPLLYDNTPSNNNPNNLEAFVEFITNGQFEISEFIDEGEIEDDYDDLIFSFTAESGFNGNIEVGQQIVGDWSAFLDDGVIVFELDFDDSFYEELEEDWDVVNFGENEIQLIDISSDGDTSTLVFSLVN